MPSYKPCSCCAPLLTQPQRCHKAQPGAQQTKSPKTETREARGDGSPALQNGIRKTDITLNADRTHYQEAIRFWSILSFPSCSQLTSSQGSPEVKRAPGAAPAWSERSQSQHPKSQLRMHLSQGWNLHGSHSLPQLFFFPRHKLPHKCSAAQFGCS